MKKAHPHIQGLQLLKAYAQSPTIALRNQIVELNMGLVKKFAYQFSRKSREPFEDLLQVGFLGLIRAIERFDLKKGVAFSSFAVPYIKGEMLHYLRDKTTTVKIPRRWQELENKSRKTQKQLRSQLGRIPTDLEMSRALALSVEEWQEYQLALKNRQLMSLDATVGHGDEPVVLGEVTPDLRGERSQQVQELRWQLREMMTHLEDKVQRAIELVYFQDLPRQEAAKLIGISPMTVTRYVDKGLHQMEDLWAS